jgi:xanthine dehydrogenase YagR molybdenum-binding subunit
MSSVQRITDHITRLRGDGDALEAHPREGGDLVPWTAHDVLQVVGRVHPRLEGAEKVTGRACYSCDVRLPGQLTVAVLRSPHPHASLVRLDARAAEAMPGVHAVLSSVNAPDIAWHEGNLFGTRLRFAGEEVAAVAAETPEQAADAVRAIDVVYEPLPFVLAAEDAQPGEPQEYRRGDVERGLAAADVVLERVYTTQCALHQCLEPHGCTVSWSGQDLTVWESTQGVYEIRDTVAATLGLPLNRVRVIAEHVGGGFGSKLMAWKHTVIAALLSRSTGRPVQFILDRSAENLAAGNRNSTRQQVRLGARHDGTLTAIAVDAVAAIGAEAVGGEASNIVGVYQRLYRCANVHTRQCATRVNLGPSCAFRAPGYVEGVFALESAIDELADALAIDPVTLRARNFAQDDQVRQQPHSTPGGLARCLSAVLDAVGPRAQRERTATGRRRRGVGIAAHEWGGAGHAPAYAWVRLNPDGSADVLTATQDIGTGTRTGLAQVAAEELGLPLSRVSLRLGDTATGPYAPQSGGSATQATLGPAVRAAAADAKRRLLRAAGTVLDVDHRSLRIRAGLIESTDGGGHALPVAELTGRLAPHSILGEGARHPNPRDRSVRTFGVQRAEVEVDTDSGEITLLRIVAAHDCGRIINPAIAESQVIGGITQGIGFALLEERVVDARSGIVLNANLEDYRVPTVADVPAIVWVGVDHPDPEANVTGAKGIGEPPIIATAAAIANAVHDAIGIRLRDAPLSRRRVLYALRAARRQA